MWFVHKNANNKISIGFFGLSSYCWYLFSFLIQENLLLNFIPKAQELVSAFFFFQRQVPFSCVSCPEGCVLGLPSLAGAVITFSERYSWNKVSHHLCQPQKEGGKFDLTQGQVRSLAESKALLLWVFSCCAVHALGQI